MTTTRYMPVTTHWVGSGPWETVYTPGQKWASLRAATTEGLHRAGGTDDFLVAEIDGDTMTGLTGAGGQPLEGWDDESYGKVAAAIGLRWNLATTPKQQPPKESR